MIYMPPPEPRSRLAEIIGGVVLLAAFLMASYAVAMVAGVIFDVNPY